MKKQGLLRLIPVIAMIVLAACGTTTPTATPMPEGITPIDPPLILKDFALTDTQNQPATLKSLQGKFSLMTFGYTHCPDVCPITLAEFKQVQTKLADAASGVNFIFVSVDGGRDTPPVLAAHLANFDERFIGWQGSDSAMRVLTGQFGVEYKLEKTSEGQTDYSVTHTAASFLVDRQGRLVRIYSYQFPIDAVAADIQQLMKEKAS